MSIRMRNRLWRQAVNTRTREFTNLDHYPAVVEAKAMVFASSCVDHPKYQGKRYPTSGCQECLAIYAEATKNG